MGREPEFQEPQGCVIKEWRSPPLRAPCAGSGIGVSPGRCTFLLPAQPSLLTPLHFPQGFCGSRHPAGEATAVPWALQAAQLDVKRGERWGGGARVRGGSGPGGKRLPLRVRTAGAPQFPSPGGGMGRGPGAGRWCAHSSPSARAPMSRAGASPCSRTPNARSRPSLGGSPGGRGGGGARGGRRHPRARTR